MAPPVVTLFEKYGAGARYIGPRVADALGVAWFDQTFSSADVESAKYPGRRTGGERFGKFPGSISWGAMCPARLSWTTEASLWLKPKMPGWWRRTRASSNKQPHGVRCCLAAMALSFSVTTRFVNMSARYYLGCAAG